MPHFSESGHDEVICQVCGRVVDTGRETVEWRPDLTGSESAGNVCAKCISNNRRVPQRYRPVVNDPRGAVEAEIQEAQNSGGQPEPEWEPICMGCGTRCGTNGRCVE